jgi:hypothetical protein
MISLGQQFARRCERQPALRKLLYRNRLSGAGVDKDA